MTNVLQVLLISMGVTMILFIVLTILILYTRNFFTRSKYIKVETFTDDKSVKIKFYKKENFNKDNFYLINPNHIFISRGYTTVIFTEHSNENINPLDFESKYDAEMYTNAIQNKLIEQTFNTLKVNKLDFMKLILIANVVTAALVIYMILKANG